MKEARAQPDRQPVLPSRAAAPPAAAGRRPRRAAAISNKSYREADTDDDSQSEVAQTPAAKARSLQTLDQCVCKDKSHLDLHFHI